MPHELMLGLSETLANIMVGILFPRWNDVTEVFTLNHVTLPGDGGMIVCISSVIPQEVMLDAFGSNSCCSSSRSEHGEECCWETVHDGGLAFADGGEASIDLGANLYSFVLKTKEKGGEEK